MTKPPEKIQLVESCTEVNELAGEGLRLLKVFLRISDPSDRALLIEFAERLAFQKKSTAN